MTLAMPDSTNVAALPAGYGQYLGYADGAWPTAAELAARFPHARLVILTVTGATLGCEGIDCEPGNPNAFQSVRWALQKLDRGDWRPVIYASVIGEPGYGMHDVLKQLAAQGGPGGIARSHVRLLSAHYGAGEHICGPATCKLISVPMDGTQWTNSFAPDVDMSALADDFFGTVATVTDIPLTICGSYTDGSGALYVIGTNAAGVLCESKRTAFGVWSAPYPIAGKTGA